MTTHPLGARAELRANRAWVSCWQSKLLRSLLGPASQGLPEVQALPVKSQGKRTATGAVIFSLTQNGCYRWQLWRYPNSQGVSLSSSLYASILRKHSHSIRNRRLPAAECKYFSAALGYSDSVSSTQTYPNKLAQEPPSFNSIQLSPHAAKPRVAHALVH